MDNKQWFKNAKIGMMSHFGLYSLFDGDYRGKPCDEWVRRHFQIPYDEYHKLAEAFNPIYFDADEWIKVAKDAGMQYFVITSKHHDGFALFHSKVSKFNVVDATPFKRDIVGELAESCYKYNMKFGLYYSQDLDWDEKDGGGFKPSEWYDESYNTWDFPRGREINFRKYLDEKALPQVEEILTNYGDLCLIWFDCPWSLTKEQSKEFVDLVKKHQPDCLVSGRIGNDMGDYGSGVDNDIHMNGTWSLNEAPITINDHWNFSIYDNNYKTAEQIRSIQAELNSKNVNLLLNVGPDHFGRLPARAVEILKQL